MDNHCSPSSPFMYNNSTLFDKLNMRYSYIHARKKKKIFNEPIKNIKKIAWFSISRWATHLLEHIEEKGTLCRR